MCTGSYNFEAKHWKKLFVGPRRQVSLGIYTVIHLLSLDKNIFI
jgi:hypothetical protein